MPLLRLWESRVRAVTLPTLSSAGWGPTLGGRFAQVRPSLLFAKPCINADKHLTG